MEQVEFLFGKIQPWELVIGVITVLIVVVVIKLILKFQAPFESLEDYDGNEERKEDSKIIARIEKARLVKELMKIVDEYEYFVGNENAAFLKKALQLDLCRHDWADVFDVAEEGSELERVAGEKAELD